MLNRRQTLEGILHNQVVFRFAQLLVGELHPSYPCAVTVDAGINCLRATDEGIEAAVRLLAAKPDSDYLKLPVAAWIIRMRDSEKYESHALPDDFPHPFMVQMRERLKWGDIKTALDLAQFRHQPAVSDALALNIARLVNEIDKDGIARVVFRAAPSPSRLKQKWGLEGFEPGN